MFDPEKWSVALRRKLCSRSLSRRTISQRPVEPVPAGLRTYIRGCPWMDYLLYRRRWRWRWRRTPVCLVWGWRERMTQPSNRLIWGRSQPIRELLLISNNAHHVIRRTWPGSFPRSSLGRFFLLRSNRYFRSFHRESTPYIQPINYYVRNQRNPLMGCTRANISVSTKTQNPKLKSKV